MKKAAIISVSDRTGIVPLAQALRKKGYSILASSGTFKFLTEAGIDVESVEDYTGFGELLGGRVKTLHPKIHAGILARRSNENDMRQLESHQIMEIELVVVNLYPFLQKLSGTDPLDMDQMLEYIDIGGPTMLRAAAKNFKDVLPVVSPDDYQVVIEHLSVNGAISPSLHWRQDMASKVFSHIAYYDLQIAKFLSNQTQNMLPEGETVDGDKICRRSEPLFGDVLIRQQELRYGENPHQRAAFYRTISADSLPWQQLNGKELSYNNILDLDSVIRILSTLQSIRPAAAIVKHNNPCGVALADSMLVALQRAKACDPRSHFGGIIGIKGEVDSETALEVVKDFAEIIVAPAFSTAALDVLSQKKNLRVLQVDLKLEKLFETRSVFGGLLWQESDLFPSVLFSEKTQVKSDLTLDQKADLQFAWDVSRHCKSNSVVLVNEGMLVGCGVGQTSRIDAVNCAIYKARVHNHSLVGAVAASDGFFPFSDSVEALASEGVCAIVAPSGSIKDAEVEACASKLGVRLLFVADRHFRH